MTVETKAYYRCDLCYGSLKSSSDGLPIGWAEVKIDPNPPGGATEQKHVCGACVQKIALNTRKLNTSE